MTEAKIPLPGSVKFYERHLIVCTGDTEWPARIELDGGFLQALADTMAYYALDMPLKVKMTACDDLSLTPAGYDILVFPDMVRYIGLKTADLETFVIDQLVSSQPSSRLQHQPLTGQHVFVCVHGRRDERCGQCGPPLLASLELELSQRSLETAVTIHQSSHVGGHVYAGNVLIYPGGDWYGNVTPENISDLIEQHMVQGKIVWELWRGRMGLAPEAQMTAVL
jgi:(2Fe-2S) ferredoxin